MAEIQVVLKQSVLEARTCPIIDASYAPCSPSFIRK
jgi:hypothetical protein